MLFGGVSRACAVRSLRSHGCEEEVKEERNAECGVFGFASSLETGEDRRLRGDCGAPQRLLDALGQFHLSKRQCREVTRPTGAGPREQNQVGMGIGAVCY